MSLFLTKESTIRCSNSLTILRDFGGQPSLINVSVIKPIYPMASFRVSIRDSFFSNVNVGIIYEKQTGTLTKLEKYQVPITYL